MTERKIAGGEGKGKAKNGTLLTAGPAGSDMGALRIQGKKWGEKGIRPLRLCARPVGKRKVLQETGESKRGDKKKPIALKWAF